jgi:hypothetical protein
MKASFRIVADGQRRDGVRMFVQLFQAMARRLGRWL